MKSIVTAPLFLSRPSAPANPDDRQIGLELVATLTANRDRCVGLAANMIGYHKRVIIDLGLFSLVMYNPVLLDKREPYQTEEGCLSLTGTRPTTWPANLIRSATSF